MNTHIHEFFRGMTAAGKKRAACAMDTDSQSPKFGYQNILQPASARASADQQSIAEGLKPVPVRYFAGNTAHFGGFGSALALSHRANPSVWNGQSQKFGYGNHLLTHRKGYGQNTRLPRRSQ